MADTPEATTTTIDSSLDGTQTEAPHDTEPADTQDSTISQEALDAAVERARREAREEYERTKQEEIDRAVQKRLERERRKKAQAAPQKDEPEPRETPDTKRTKAEIVQQRSVERLFDRSYAKHGDHLTERQLGIVENAFMADPPDPEDVATWWKESLEDLGWAKPETSPAQRTEPASNGEAKAEPMKKSNPAAVDNTAVSGSVSWKQILDPTQLTSEHIQQIRQDKGVRGGNKYIREMWENWGHTARVLPPTPSK